MKFKKITFACTSETTDTVAYMLHDVGSMGEVFDDYADIKSVLDDKRWDYADARLFERTDSCSVSGFFSIEADENRIIKHVMSLKTETWADFSALKASVEIIDSAEWENEWKKYYKPFNIGRIVIVPEWIDYTPTGGDRAVKLNPGLAFGTGMHETTSMCIDLMQKIDLKGKRVLDFGCGSGILGICATILGAKNVIFADTDEQAITATEYNCKLNDIEPEVYLKDVRTIDERSNVVLANITADVLLAVRPIIESALENGGYAIISGIISAQKDAVLKAYSADFTLMEHQEKNEWSAYLLKL